MLLEVFQCACERCYFFGSRVEYEQIRYKCVKNTICSFCKQKALN